MAVASGCSGRRGLATRPSGGVVLLVWVAVERLNPRSTTVMKQIVDRYSLTMLLTGVGRCIELDIVRVLVLEVCLVSLN